MAYGKNKFIAVMLAIMVALTWSFPAFAADEPAPDAGADKDKTEAVAEEPAPPEEKAEEEEPEPAEEPGEPAPEPENISVPPVKDVEPQKVEPAKEEAPVAAAAPADRK